MKILADNKKARFNYQIQETFEVGIVLSGPEVKSVKLGHINLKDSYATISGKEAWLLNAHIAPYKFAIQKDYNPNQSRKLLLKRKEINSLIGKLQTKGSTLIPLRVYSKKGLIKIELGLGRGKKLFDKREQIKKRELKREIEREIKEKK